MSIPVLGVLLYQLQIFLVEGEILQHAWVSRKEHRLQSLLLQTVLQNSQVVICSAWQLGQQLRQLKGKYVFEYQDQHPKHLSLAELYCVEWALILANSTTLRSVKKLGNLLPNSFPIWSPYIISVHQPLDAQCDFIWQTIKELLARGSAVTVLTHIKQPAAVMETLEKIPHLNVICTQPPSLMDKLPYSLRRQMHRLWESYVKERLQETTASVAHAVLWCFDPDDVQALRFRPNRSTVIYDCVDFHVSLNPELQKRLAKDQKKLMELADLMFVNSHSLLKAHQKHREDILLVPQGFDGEVFSSKKIPAASSLAKKFLTQLQRQRKKYRGIVSYVGALSYRVDYQVLEQLITKNPKVLFCLPQNILSWPSEDEATQWQAQLDVLQDFPNVLWFPSLTRSEVRLLLQKTSVGLIPYDDQMLYNKYCFPMKLFEYMSAGIPTLSTQILELKYYQPFAEVGKDTVELNTLLRKLLKKKFSVADFAQMKELCKTHAWNNKVGLIVNAINEHQRRTYRFG